ncbi:MAG: hypothetical protein AAFX99_22255 [Myxococcota bacterium]
MSVWESVGRIYDALATHERVERLERWVLLASGAGLMLHLGIIGLARLGWLPGDAAIHVGTNFLSALYTPFSFILFFEVLQLVLSIPRSMTSSLGKQYEIVSLIVLRSVFKDVAHFEGLSSFEAQYHEFVSVLWDMGGGIGMFLLVAIFYHTSGRVPKTHREPLDLSGLDDALKGFIAQKKGIALGLAVLLFVLAAYNLGLWCMEAWHVVFEAGQPVLNVDTIFYLDLLTVMVFADVLILLLSMWHDDTYQMVFRNAGYVVSTVLLRFSLSIDKPYNVELGLLAMAFGIAVALVYRYWCYLASRHDHTQNNVQA